MKKFYVFVLVFLSGCATPKAPMQYDFGAAAQHSTTCTPLEIAVRAENPWASSEIHYRLWQDSKALYAYTQSLWGKEPPLLLKDAILQRYYEKCSGLPSKVVLQVEIVEFSHIFENQHKSYGQVVVDAFLQAGQENHSRRFAARAASLTPDAPGGVSALHEASLLLADDILLWLRQQSKENAAVRF
jgi:ABC-type uncharacterized transport system auxiliary subunit